MKKFFVIAASLLLTVTAASAAVFTLCDDDRPIKYEELPAESKSFIDNYFGKEKVSHVTIDRDLIGTEYKVVFMSGTKLEFVGSGEWKEIDCRYTAVPEALIPSAIVDYVNEYYPESKIVELKHDYRGWEVKLTGGLELTFNDNFKLVDIDD